MLYLCFRKSTAEVVFCETKETCEMLSSFLPGTVVIPRDPKVIFDLIFGHSEFYVPVSERQSLEQVRASITCPIDEKLEKVIVNIAERPYFPKLTLDEVLDDSSFVPALRFFRIRPGPYYLARYEKGHALELWYSGRPEDAIRLQKIIKMTTGIDLCMGNSNGSLYAAIWLTRDDDSGTKRDRISRRLHFNEYGRAHNVERMELNEYFDLTTWTNNYVLNDRSKAKILEIVSRMIAEFKRPTYYLFKLSPEPPEFIFLGNIDNCRKVKLLVGGDIFGNLEEVRTSWLAISDNELPLDSYAKYWIAMAHSDFFSEDPNREAAKILANREKFLREGIPEVEIDLRSGKEFYLEFRKYFTEALEDPDHAVLKTLVHEVDKLFDNLEVEK